MNVLKQTNHKEAMISRVLFLILFFLLIFVFLSICLSLCISGCLNMRRNRRKIEIVHNVTYVYPDDSPRMYNSPMFTTFDPEIGYTRHDHPQTPTRIVWWIIVISHSHPPLHKLLLNISHSPLCLIFTNSETQISHLHLPFLFSLSYFLISHTITNFK